jgi:hypothetical protein
LLVDRVIHDVPACQRTFSSITAGSNRRGAAGLTANRSW